MAATLDDAFNTWMREIDIPEAILRMSGDVRSAFELGGVIAALWTAIQLEHFENGAALGRTQGEAVVPTQVAERIASRPNPRLGTALAERAI